MKDFTFLIILIPMLISFIGLFILMREANKFFRKCDLIEGLIKNDEPKERVIQELISLSKKSFHKQTGSRLRKLAKMAEDKYDIKFN